MKRKGSAIWEGTLREGRGQVSSDSGALSGVPYTFGMRFESDRGTNPEELIAAAHAGCFSMALSGGLQKAGFDPKRIDTEAVVTLEKGDDGFSITAVHLTTRAEVPGADREGFAKAAADAKKGCPVSKVLNADITLEATLVT